MRFFIRPDGRYYVLSDPVLDLFGEEVYLTFHGSIHNRLGGMKRWPVACSDVEHIVRTRLRHGYIESAGLFKAVVIGT